MYEYLEAVAEARSHGRFRGRFLAALHAERGLGAAWLVRGGLLEQNVRRLVPG